MAYVKYGTTDEGIECYAFEDFYLFLYDDYMKWEKRILHRESAIIHYSDISSVSYSNGGFFAKAYLSVGTTGRTYHVRTVDSPYSNMYSVANAIEERRVMALNAKSQSADKISAADEIIKLKSLMEQGIITQREFEAKKKQLLGL